MNVGPRELTGALDLVSHYKLLPHHEFFCKKSRPVSVLETHYLCNVVGDTDIRKGEGMQLNQLIQNISSSRDTYACIQPFKLDVLGEAFHLRESASVNLPPSEKGIPTVAVQSKSESKDKSKHKKDKYKDREKDKELKKRIHRSREKEKENKKYKNDKKKKNDGDEDTNGIKRHKKSKHKSSKTDEVGVKRLAA
ncbi:hypothetical protein BUALT_Bualt08G0120000 [Buddleja alternifolia]|uniref:Mediator of RNA polymerase II transcription subunit 19 n=1 Tax=Buddleja alternifolia TaxID=168488 RepID=A0AAV6X5Q5_9LAMI|nr:hypothetical protein BUALT_Bualt08G0120000 [Buddleja alternifolia]